MQDDSALVSLLPHMHFRGKDFEYRVTYPSGEKETLLAVPHYDFNWQLTYDLAQPKLLPKGTVIECTAHFDNSPNNKYNPDPTKEVHFGEQSMSQVDFDLRRCWPLTYIPPVKDSVCQAPSECALLKLALTELEALNFSKSTVDE